MKMKPKRSVYSEWAPQESWHERSRIGDNLRCGGWVATQGGTHPFVMPLGVSQRLMAWRGRAEKSIGLVRRFKPEGRSLRSSDLLVLRGVAAVSLSALWRGEKILSRLMETLRPEGRSLRSADLLVLREANAECLSGVWKSRVKIISIDRIFWGNSMRWKHLCCKSGPVTGKQDFHTLVLLNRVHWLIRCWCCSNDYFDLLFSNSYEISFLNFFIK
jgi:hypothetical protein